VISENTEGKEPSMMKFYLQEKVHKVEIGFYSKAGS
jgi:hypothetical protein